MAHPSVRWFAALLVSAGCSTAPASPGGQPPTDTTSTGFDVVFGGDLPAKADAGTTPDSLVADDTPDGAFDVEIVLASGTFGAPCTVNSDCAGQWCVESQDGKVCSQTCVDACPAGFTCAQVQLGSTDTSFVCMPAYVRLCDPCANSSDCNGPGASGNLCVVQGPLGGFCGVACNAGDPKACPAGYLCSAVTDSATNKPSWQCTRQTGDCPCSPLAAQKALQTACSLNNAWGTCSGARSCVDGTLSSCSASVPAEEACNGADDDCNGKTDDVSGQPACVAKNDWGVCNGILTGCQDGKALCSAKEPAQEVCNLQDDDCDGATDEELCEDGIGCTQGACNADGSCKQTPLSGPACDDGNICSSKDACAQGKCQGSAEMGCDDDNPCTADGCDPVTGCSHAVQDGACADDGNPCTLDQCQAGKCAHAVMPSGTACPDDGSPCTLDVCENDACKHPAIAAGSPCPDDGDACTLDACDGKGACKGTAKDCSALSSICTVGTCDKGSGQCSAEAKAGACSDNDSCTKNDSCQQGVCKGTVLDCSSLASACNVATCQAGECQVIAKSGACDDGNPCTMGDACVGGGCLGTALNCAGSSDACNDGVCQSGVCAKLAKGNGTSCNDGDSCTSADKCTTGKCAGAAISCTALTDGCNDGVCAAGGCVKKQKASGTSCSDGESCTVNDACQGGVCKGATKDCTASGDPCNDGVCASGGCIKKPKVNGTGCNDGSTCTSDDVCSGGTCVGSPIKDLYEPNESSPGKAIPDRTDCEGPSSLTASMSPKGDVDWYSWTASDKAGCTIKPSAGLSVLAADYDVCAYFLCGNGKTGSGTVSCVSGTKVSNGPGGAWGCCSSNTGTASELAKIGPTCTFLGAGDESGKVWVKVQAKSSSATCGGYKLEWSAKN